MNDPSKIIHDLSADVVADNSLCDCGYEMTEQKYKVGDEVLVMAKIDEHDGNDTCRVLFKNDLVRIKDSDIYGIAPEFTPGEEIEVSNLDATDWEQREFFGVD